MSVTNTDASPSSFPSSMGAGARQVSPGQRSEPSLLQEVAEIRSHYSVNMDDSNLKVGYELQGQLRNYTLPFDAMPLSGLGKWLVWGGKRRSMVSGAYLLDTMRGAENMSGRRLNQKEAEGFAFHCAKKALYAYGGAVTSVVGGYWLAWSGRQKMKFPFISPKPAEKYENFPNKYLPVLKGSQARLMWQVTRANVYVGLLLLFVQPLFSSMGDTVMTVGLYRDDRTKEIVKSIKGSFDRLQSNRARSARLGVPMPDQQPSQEQDADGYNNTDSQAYYKDMESNMSNDYSGDNAHTNGSTDTGMLSDSTMRQQESRQSSPTGFSSSQNDPQRRQSSFPQQQQQSQSYTKPDTTSATDMIWDDASPTAGSYPNTNTSGPYQQSSRGEGGSTWERIRRGISSSASSQPQSTQPSSQQSNSRPESLPSRLPPSSRPNSAESFSFSNTDEERQLAKEQAQKEFDDMLERERKDSGSVDYAKEMYATGSGRESGGKSGGGGGSAWDRRRQGPGGNAS